MHGLTIKRRILIAYILVVALGIAISLVIYALGQSTMQTSSILLTERIPLFKEVSNLKAAANKAEPILYEYYATMDRENFLNRYKANQTSINSGLKTINEEHDDRQVNDEIHNLFAQLNVYSLELDEVMSSGRVDWDKAREILLKISATARDIEAVLSRLDTTIQQKVETSIHATEDKTTAMIGAVFLFSIIISIVAIFIAYYVNRYLTEAAERRRLALFPEKNPLAVFQLSSTGQILYSNPSCQQLLLETGLDSEDVAVLLPEGFVSQLSALRRGNKQHTVLDYEVGSCVIELVAHFIKDFDVFHIYMKNITKGKIAEKKLRESEKRYRALYDDNPSMFFTLDIEENIESVNQFGARHLGYQRQDLLGKAILDLCKDKDIASLQEVLTQAVSSSSELHRWEGSIYHNDGDIIRIRATVRVVYNQDDVAKFLIVCEDVTETHKLSLLLSYQASHDDLTGLINRREFERRVERVLQDAKTDRSGHALCYMDLDQFKIVNDTCGHAAGDELLRQLSKKFSFAIRKRDTLARLGGDEFGILLEHCSLSQAWRVANTLKDQIKDFRFYWQGKMFEVGISIGLVSINETSDNLTNILNAADSACYTSKNAGGDRIHIHDETDNEFVRRRGEVLWVSRINQALKENRFRLFQQKIAPVFGDDEGEHYEILLRMIDEKGELVGPGVFIPVAEHYKLSNKLDRWVIKSTLEWLSEHPDKLENLSMCSINLSGQSLSDEQLLSYINKQFGIYKVPYEKICFEVTETAAIANLSIAMTIITSLKVWGCKFALDDFGSGLSSFAYLKNLPVDYLKIDGTFVKEITENPIDYAMVKSINDVAHVMGKHTIAEFVENDEILSCLRDIGVNYVQGYGIGEPQMLAETVEYAQQQSVE